MTKWTLLDDALVFAGRVSGFDPTNRAVVAHPLVGQLESPTQLHPSRLPTRTLPFVLIERQRTLYLL